MAARWCYVTIALAAGVTVFALLAVPSCRQVSNGALEPVTIGGETFRLEVAADEVTRTHGLMGREHIPEDGGMIFIFPDARMRSFWMGNCLVDIDILFLDPQGRVTALHRMKAESPRRHDESELAYQIRLASYPSRYPAQFALEFRAGTLDRLGLAVDDKVELDLPRLKALVH